ncbi:MAG: methionine synthase [Spirochaetales bacterium]|jgi:hypothetical protein|nr:methionine synthase [Spirochaetales bacterium]
MKSPLLFDIPFQIDMNRYKQAIRYEYLDDARNEAILLLEIASKRLNPKVMLIEAFIDRHLNDGNVPVIAIGDIRFHGKALRALDGVHRIIPYIATCGDGMEDFDLSAMDMLAPYWLDELKSQALDQARKALRSLCNELFGIRRALSLNPGSGNVDIWPIEELQELFCLFGPDHRKVGVSLSQRSLMIPNKSIAGLLFANSEVDYESCAHCERANCPNRRVPFKARL